MICLDVRCDYCGESTRYVNPPIDVTLEALVSDGRESTPVDAFAALPELFRFLMRGLSEAIIPGQPTRYTNSLRLCSVCGPMLGTADGQAALVTKLADRVRPLPSIKPSDAPPPDVPTPMPSDPIGLTLPASPSIKPSDAPPPDVPTPMPDNPPLLTL